MLLLLWLAWLSNDDDDNDNDNERLRIPLYRSCFQVLLSSVALNEAVNKQLVNKVKGSAQAATKKSANLLDLDNKTV